MVLPLAGGAVKMSGNTCLGKSIAPTSNCGGWPGRSTQGIWLILNPLIPAAAGLGGVFLGGWLGDRREREKRRVSFITRQLSEFYGPLVSIRSEIRARGELRLKIETAIDEKHMRGLLDAGQHGDANAFERATDETLAPMLAVMHDEYKIFTDISMPLYRKMLDVFRERMWLAEPETRYLPLLIEFVDVWERYIRGTMPDEVVREIKHTRGKPTPVLRSFDSNT